MANPIKLPKFRKGDKVWLMRAIVGTIEEMGIPDETNDEVAYQVKWDNEFYDEDELEKVNPIDDLTIEELEQILKRKQEEELKK